MKLCQKCKIHIKKISSYRKKYCSGCLLKSKRVSDKKYQKEKRKRLVGYKTKESRNYRKKYPEKFRAQQFLNYYLRLGKVKKFPCKKCGSKTVHAHHSDYSKPLNVTWLCPVHHRELHKK